MPGVFSQIVGPESEVSIIDISAVTDGLKEKEIGISVSGDDGPVVACAELVARVPKRWFEVVLGPLGRLVDFVHRPVGDLRV